MRKYLLLATVAGCMVSTCAFAGGSIATNKQSAIINVKANIKIATELRNLQDMDFGTLYVLSGTTGDLVSLSTAGEVSIINAGVVAKKGTPKVGSINSTSDGLWERQVTCADGTGAPLSGDSCSLGNGLELKNVVASGGGYGDPLILAGTLKATSAITQAKNVDAAGLKVEIQY